MPLKDYLSNFNHFRVVIVFLGVKIVVCMVSENSKRYVTPMVGPWERYEALYMVGRCLKWPFLVLRNY